MAVNEVDFYNKIKPILQKQIPELKKIALWNNQFERYDKENSWGFPCLFIQFTPNVHDQFLRGIQNVEFTITFHIGLESYLDEDTRIFELKQKLFKVVHYFECNNWTRCERIAERPDFDHDAYQVYEMDFRSVLTDYTDDNRPTIPVTALPSVTLEIKKPNELE